MSSAHSLPNLAAARRAFFHPLAFSAGALLAIHVLPKAQDGELLRLILVLVYFGAIFAVLAQLTVPRERYLEQLYRWRFAGCSAGLEEAWKMYLYGLNETIRIVAGLAGILAGSTAIRVLAMWLTPLAPLAELAWWTWWLGALALLTLPLWCRQQISKVWQRWCLLREAQVTLEFETRKEPAGEAAHPALDAVTVLGAGRFRAGGFDWQWDDFHKNAIVFGQTGSGKTACVLNALLEGLLSSAAGELPAGGLILDPKGDFRGKIEGLCKRYGRADSLLVFDPARPAHSIRWNPLDSADDELELAAQFAAVLESVDGNGGQSDPFWVEAPKTFVANAVTLLRLTNPPGTPPSFTQLYELTGSLRHVSERCDRLRPEQPGAFVCLNYFADIWAPMAAETRSGIQAHLSNMLDAFLREPYATTVSGRSMWRMSDIVEQGKILYVHMPIADREAMARRLCTFVKLAYFREVLRRINKPRHTFFLCDEFQSFLTTLDGKGDADFFERSRQSNHANLIATQNRPALLKRAPRPEVVDNLLGNCAVKIFLRNGDTETNRYASELFGQALDVLPGTNLSMASGKQAGPVFGHAANRQYDARIRPERFQALAIPVRGSDQAFAESIAWLGSRAQVESPLLNWPLHTLEWSNSPDRKR